MLIYRDEFYEVNSKYYDTPEYSTDPRRYDISEFKDMIDEEYEKAVEELLVFINEYDANDCVYACLSGFSVLYYFIKMSTMCVERMNKK